jgi:hypothetical protein
MNNINSPSQQLAKALNHRRNGSFQLPPAADMVSLAVQSVQLAQVLATQERDIKAIETVHKERLKLLDNVHTEVMAMIDKEYASRDLQAQLIHSQVTLLIQAGQHEIAERILTRLTELLSQSPLEKAMQYRITGTKQLLD